MINHLLSTLLQVILYVKMEYFSESMLAFLELSIYEYNKVTVIVITKQQFSIEFEQYASC